MRDLEQYQTKIDKNLVHHQRSNIRDQIASEIFQSVLRKFAEEIAEEQLGMNEAAQEKAMNILANVFRSNRNMTQNRE